LSDSKETCIFSTYIFFKYSNIKFNENPSSDGRVVPCGRTDGQTDITKLIVTCRYFAKVPKRDKVAVFHISIFKF